MSIAPVRRSVSVKAPPARAFDLFVRDIGRWWPAPMHIGATPFATIVIEPHTGGRWYQRSEDGAETPWGEVLAWDPPIRLLLAWRIGANWTYDPDLLTEVELTFTAHPTGTLVSLEHRRLEQFGASADRMAQNVGTGWPRVLQALADFAAASSTPEGDPPNA
jgi:uncharacterized protein YndB with AHSA1/START domain